MRKPRQRISEYCLISNHSEEIGFIGFVIEMEEMNLVIVL